MFCVNWSGFLEILRVLDFTNWLMGKEGRTEKAGNQEHDCLQILSFDMGIGNGGGRTDHLFVN
jgi:hypothetical protein